MDVQITYPPQVVIQKSEILLNAFIENAVISSGLSTNGVLVLLTFHDAGDTITLSWNGNTIIFTCIAEDDGSPGTYPVRQGAETIQAWGERVFRAIASNFNLVNDFSISGEPGTTEYQIHFIAFVQDSAYNLTVSSTGITYLVNASYISPVRYENFKLRLQLLYESIQDETIVYDKYRTAVYIPMVYDNRDLVCSYDLSRRLSEDMFNGHFSLQGVSNDPIGRTLGKICIQLSFMADNLDAFSIPIDGSVYVLPGKISKTKEKALNTAGTSLYAELQSSKRFLTWAPLSKVTDVYAPEKLYFLFNSVLDNVNLKITERLSDSTSETRILATFNSSAFTFYEFSIGYQAIKQDDYGSKSLVDYDIWLESSTGSLISERRTFVMDYKYQRMARYFMFKNSFGMYEVFRSTGDAQKINKVDKAFYTRVKHSMTDSDQSRSLLSLSQALAMKVSTGYLESPWNFYLASEFLSSEDVYWLKNDRAYAVQIEGSDPVVSESDLSNMNSFDFQVAVDDMDDGFFEEFLPGSELPITGDFNSDFSDDFYK